jgi:hypothetical protein
MIIRISLSIACAIVFPLACFAQSPSSDSKYCNALADKYDSLVDTSGSKGGSAAPPDIQSAIDKCNSSPASAIPVLEKALKDKRITLPARS